MNTPIDKLITEYEEEDYDFDNLPKLINNAYRYVDTMEDSQVRCFLYKLAQKLEERLSMADMLDPKLPPLDMKLEIPNTASKNNNDKEMHNKNPRRS